MVLDFQESSAIAFVFVCKFQYLPQLLRLGENCLHFEDSRGIVCISHFCVFPQPAKHLGSNLRYREWESVTPVPGSCFPLVFLSPSLSSLSSQIPDAVTLAPGSFPRLSPCVSQSLRSDARCCNAGSGVVARLSGWTDSFVSLRFPSGWTGLFSQPRCLARLSGQTGSFVSLCPFICLLLGCLRFICLPLSPFTCLPVPGCLARLFAWFVV